MKALAGKVISGHITNNNGWGNLQEEDVNSGPVGSHSNWKLASTLARWQGCTQDDVDCHGRWQNTQHISDRYTDLTLEASTVSHHVITVIFALLATGSIKNSTFGGMVYITTEVAKIVVSLVRGFTTLTTTYLPDTRVSFFWQSTTF